MPSALFVCPHCEKHAEVQVTSVTRSRPCPHCNELVVLQVAAKDKKAKRRALLVSVGGAPVFSEEPISGGQTPAYDPMPLEGEVFERMKLDPEVLQARRRFMLGVYSVAALIVLAVIWHFVPDSSGEKVQVPVVKTESEAPAVPPGAKLPKNAVGLRYSTKDAKGTGQSKLSFESVNGSDAAAASASAVSSAALAVAQRFLKSSTVEQQLDTVADRVVIERALREWAASHPMSSHDDTQLALDDSSSDQDGQWCVNATLKNGDTKQLHVVLDQGNQRVDWPSFVAWSDMDWKQFVEQRPTGPRLFRVLADDAQHFESAFSDSKALRCMKLLNPAAPASPPIYAYVDRRSTVGSELDFLLRQTTARPVKITLRLKFPSDPVTHDQVWIENVVTSGWVFRDLRSTAQAGRR